MSNKLDIGPRARQIVEARFHNPTWTIGELAKALNVTPQRISQVLHNPRVTALFPILARRKRTSLIPKAIGRIESLMDQSENMAVAFNASKAVLDSEKVLEPNTQLHIHRLESMTIDELRSVVSDAAKIPQPVIEAEIVTESKNENE